MCIVDSLHLWLVLLSLHLCFYTFLIVSLIIAVFEETFSQYNAIDRTKDRIVSRMAIIAAFIVLDKDSGGSLDKEEFLDFLNGTCHTGRQFEVDDDFELSGPDFIELCEELVHEMHKQPLKTASEVEFETGKSFASCTSEELCEYLYRTEVPHLPPRDKFDFTNEKNVLEYWRHRKFLQNLKI